MWNFLKAIPRNVRRFVGSGALAVLLLVVGAPMAFAKGLGQTPRALAWITLKDSHGIPLWNHELSIDRGGTLSPDKMIYAYTTDGVWGIYKSYVAFALWFLDWVLSLHWLQVLARPMLMISDALQSVVGHLGLTIAFLTITMLVAGVMMLRGHTAMGLYEIGIAMVIASLATGVLANPVRLVVGDDGYIATANKLGQEISNKLNSVANGSESTVESAREKHVGKMVDVFIRQPLQLINYGEVLDGGKCESAYDEVVKDGPYGDEPTIREKIAACDADLGEVAASTNAAMATSASVFMPAGLLVVTLLMLVAGSVVAAGGWAVYQSAKGIWALAQGTLPGSSRGMLFATVGSIIESLVVIVVAGIFLGITMLVLQAVFGQPENVGKRFAIADIVIAVAIVVWIRARRRMKSMGRRLAEWMSQRPGGAATQIPAAKQRSGGKLASAGRLAMQAYQLTQLKNLNQPGGSVTNNTAVFVMGQPRPAMSGGGGYAFQTGTGGQPGGSLVDQPALEAGSRKQLPGGPDGAGNGPLPVGPGPGGPRPELPRGSALARIEGRTKPKGIIRPLATTAATVALAVASGGTSAAVAGTSKVMLAARKVRRFELMARLSKHAVSGVGRTMSGASRPAPDAPVVTGRVLDAPTTPPVVAAPDGRRAHEPRPLDVKPTRPSGRPQPPSRSEVQRTNESVPAARADDFKAKLATRMRGRHISTPGL